MAAKKPSKANNEINEVIDEIMEEVVEDVVEEVAQEDIAVGAYYVVQGKLFIHVPFIHPVSPDVTRIIVENVGGGDIYYGTEEAMSGKYISVGETVEIEGATCIVLTAASRPSFRIIEFK